MIIVRCCKKNPLFQNVLLLDGEDLKGAKQNRIPNTTILIAGGNSLDVPVNCTKQGRWSYPWEVAEECPNPDGPAVFLVCFVSESAPPRVLEFCQQGSCFHP